MPRPRPNREFLQGLKAAYDAGERVREIAARLGKTEVTISSWLKMVGTKMRKAKDYPITDKAKTTMRNNIMIAHALRAHNKILKGGE